MMQISSRERMIAALDRKLPDHIPCCFMSFTALRRRCHEDLFALSLAEIELGLDSMLFLPSAPRSARREHPDLRGFPIRFHPQVQSRHWKETTPEGASLLFREYQTPAGRLAAAVRLTEDWPHGDFLPFIDDYQVSHLAKPLIMGREDLEALRFLLMPPGEGDIDRFNQEILRAKAFAETHGILLATGWGVGLDMAGWLLGLGNLIALTMDQPAFVQDLLRLIHEWDLQRMDLVLSAQPDLFIRRAWYEGCDFITPARFREVLLPLLKAEVDLAHERGARFGYICTSGTLPMLDMYAEAGIDVLMGVDPIQGTRTDLRLTRQTAAGRVAVWGGVSGAITVEQGSEREIREAVDQAIAILGPDGFILSPVDNITLDQPRTWRNVEHFINAWRNSRITDSDLVAAGTGPRR